MVIIGITILGFLVLTVLLGLSYHRKTIDLLKAQYDMALRIVDAKHQSEMFDLTAYSRRLLDEQKQQHIDAFAEKFQGMVEDLLRRHGLVFNLEDQTIIQETLSDEAKALVLPLVVAEATQMQKPGETWLTIKTSPPSNDDIEGTFTIQEEVPA